MKLYKASKIKSNIKRTCQYHILTRLTTVNEIQSNVKIKRNSKNVWFNILYISEFYKVLNQPGIEINNPNNQFRLPFSFLKHNSDLTSYSQWVIYDLTCMRKGGKILLDINEVKKKLFPIIPKAVQKSNLVVWEILSRVRNYAIRDFNDL